MQYGTAKTPQGLGESTAEALRILANLYICHQQHEKALTLLLALRELRPDDRSLLVPLCHALLQKGRYTEALAISDEMLEPASSLMQPDAEGTSALCMARLRAEALWGLGYAEEARRVLEEALERNRSGAA